MIINTSIGDIDTSSVAYRVGLEQGLACGAVTGGTGSASGNGSGEKGDLIDLGGGLVKKTAYTGYTEINLGIQYVYVASVDGWWMPKENFISSITGMLERTSLTYETSEIEEQTYIGTDSSGNKLYGYTKYVNIAVNLKCGWVLVFRAMSYNPINRINPPEGYLYSGVYVSFFCGDYVSSKGFPLSWEQIDDTTYQAKAVQCYYPGFPIPFLDIRPEAGSKIHLFSCADFESFLYFSSETSTYSMLCAASYGVHEVTNLNQNQTISVSGLANYYTAIFSRKYFDNPETYGFSDITISYDGGSYTTSETCYVSLTTTYNGIFVYTSKDTEQSFLVVVFNGGITFIIGEVPFILE